MQTPINRLAADEAAAIRAEQVRWLYANIPTALLGNVLIAVFLAGMQWDIVAAPLIIAWLVMVTVTLAVRMLLFIARRRALSIDDRIWLQRFRISITAIGVVWGLAGLLIFPPHNIPHQAFLTFALGGVVSAAITTLSIDRVSLLAFTLPALIPVIVRLLVEGSAIQTSMSVMMIAALMRICCIDLSILGMACMAGRPIISVARLSRPVFFLIFTKTSVPAAISLRLIRTVAN